MKGGATSGGSTDVRQGEIDHPARGSDQGRDVQSANDACIVIAEGLAGSEENFAAQMTERAREIGLTKSVFKNSNGLPAKGQVVTMREVAFWGGTSGKSIPNITNFTDSANSPGTRSRSKAATPC